MALWPGEVFHHSTSCAASRSQRTAMTSPAPLLGFSARGSVQKLARCSMTSRVAMLLDHSCAMPATVAWYFTAARPLDARYSLIRLNTVRMAAVLLSGTRASGAGSCCCATRCEGVDGAVGWARSASGAHSGGMEAGSGGFGL